MAKYQITTTGGTYEIETADAPPQSSNPNAGKGAAEGFWDSTIGGALSTAKHYLVDQPVDALSGAYSAAQKGNYGEAATRVLGLAVNNPADAMAQDVVKSSANQIQQSRQALRQGDYSRAALHGFGAIPVVGPQVAETAENIADPQSRSYGIGQAVGAAATLAAPKVIESLPIGKLATKAASALKGSAEENIYRALNPTKEVNKVLTRDQVAPGLVERGVTATSRDDLMAQAQAKMQEHGQAIDDYFQQNGNVTVGAKPILDRLDKLGAGKSKNGVTPAINQSYLQGIDDLKSDVQNMAQANGGKLTLEDARWLRQQYDKVAASKNAFALAPAEQTKLAALTDGTNAIRSELASQFPDLAAVNKEFNFWSNVNRVAEATDLRKTGQSKGLLREIAANSAMAAVGVGTHNPLAALGAKAAMGKLAQLQSSVLWHTMSAQAKVKVAQLVQSGNAQGALQFANQAAIAGLAMRGQTPDSQPGEPQ